MAVPSMTPSDFYERLIREAPLTPGDNGEEINPEKIEWFNPELLKEGQEFISRNYCAQALALSGSLIFGTCFKSVTTVLLRTGGFSTTAKSFVRHVETEIHVDRWQTENIMDSGSKGFQDLQYVRQLHLHALRMCERIPLELTDDRIQDKEEKLKIVEALKKDLECLDTSQSPSELLTYYPKVFFSQFDFAMVLYGMYAVIFMFPKLLGIRDQRGMGGFVHFWALVGRLLGVQDRFNPALCPDRDLHIKIFHNIMLASLKDLDVIMLDLSEIYTQVLAKVGLPMSFKAILYAGLNTEAVPEFKGENLYQLMSWWDIVCVKVIQVSIFSMYYIPLTRVCANQYVRLLSWISRRRTARDRSDQV